jgi:sugar (pentulose or hexulose) kinase
LALFIGIDLGTSGCRAMAVDEADAIHHQTAVTLPAPQRDGAAVEQDAALWWDAVDDCLQQLTRHIAADQVQAIAVDGTSGTLLLCDEHGEPLGPALMYNDARAIPQAERIHSAAPAETAAQGPSCSLAKLLWFYDANCDTASARHALHQADWIAAHLSGRLGITDTNNAMKLGFDAQQGRWPDWLHALLDTSGIPRSLLPEVAVPGTAIGQLIPALAQRYGLPQSTRIVAGTTDSTASFLATGASCVGEAVTALGSTLVVKVIAAQPVFATEYGVYSQPLFVDGKQRWLVGGASNSGGAVLRQCFSDAQMQAMTPALKPEQPTGLNYYPLPAVGERFPVNDPELAPRLTPRPGNDTRFFQGLLEGIARIEAQAYDLLAKLGAPYPVSVRSTGGGAQNAAWTEIRQRLLQTEMEPAHNTEAAYGAALLAQQAIIKQGASA